MKNLFQIILSNWKTTLAALLSLASLVFNCWSNGGGLWDCITEALPIVFVGGGLFLAGDGDLSKK